VFLPFQQLGLVIVDEEHETSYKQQDPPPRYHARDAAIFLSHLWKCKTVLGSATPSFESYYNCKTDKYALIEMKERFNKVDLPKIITANIAEETRVKTMKENFTSVLFHEIENALSHHEQIILFQNRRGYAPVLECQECQWVPKCVNCDISLTYHKSIDSLKCHYCGHTQNLPKSCPACGSGNINLKGIGTEKIEDELAVLFPEARVSRLDLDSSKTKHGHEQIIQSFENHEADILVGTQMIGKGLDFEKVSVVGIINADQLIYFPDFRAHERAYQLISQVSGRAGRRDKQGKVVIQTSSPNHPVIEEIIQHGYENIYANEIVERKIFGYPPFTRLIKISVKHRDYKIAAEASFVLKNNLENTFGENIIGPESPHVSKIRNMYIKEMLIKIDRNSTTLNELKQHIKSGIQRIKEIDAYKLAIIFADVDPF
jgi:primosomal protein N' (replication factor Y) (superfamily II helicase)